MAKYIDAEKLIAEIERWRDQAKEDYNESTHSMGRCDALAEFSNHIVSLQQEQHPLPSNLDEAATQAANQMEIPTEHSQPESLTLVMRHIAFEMFKAGAEWQKQQMIEEAVDGEVCKYDKFSYVKEKNSKRFLTELLAKFNDGDKVKIIIIKEDKK